MPDSSATLALARITRWAFPLIIISLSTLFWLWGDSVRVVLGYDRSAIADGDYFRLLSGHLLHLNLRHLALNLAGFGLILILARDSFRARDWIWGFLFCACITGLALYFFHPGLRYYLGLSGVLHGLLVFTLLCTNQLTRPLKIVGLLALSIKLGIDLGSHGGMGSGGFIGGRVLPETHLYGAVSGLVAALIFICSKGTNRSSR